LSTTQEKEKLPRNVIWVSLASFFNDVSGEIVVRALPLFLAGTLGVGYSVIGIIEGVADSTSSFLKIFAGWYSDKIRNRKRMTAVGYALTTVARPILIGVNGWVLPLISRFLDRAGKGIRSAPRDALVADSVSHTERGKAFGFLRALDPAGGMVGALIAAGTLYFFQGNVVPGESISRDLFDTLIYIAIFPTAISVLLVAFLVKEPAHHGVHKDAKSISFRTALSHKRFRNYLLILFIFTLGSSSDAFLILRANSLGVGPLGIFIIYALLNLVSSFSSYPMGALSDRYSRRKMIMAGWIMYAFIYFGFAFSTQAWHTWGLFVLYGFFFGLTEGVERALVADLVPTELRGTAYGLYNGILGLGLFPASLIAGLLWENFGAEAPFLFGGGMAIVSALLISQMSFRRKDTTVKA
jgi:MFS family permease